MNAQRPRYIERNHLTRMPQRFIYLDSEAQQTKRGRKRIQSYRLSVAALDRRTDNAGTWAEREWASFTSVADQWEWITEQCRPDARTVLVAHKLDYDLRLTDGLRQLTERGWNAEWIRVGERSTMGTFKRGKRTLIMLDSLGWISKPLAEVGKLIGLPKLDLPRWEESNEAWFARCTRDVEILATAFRQIMQWIKDEDLGNWKPTGAGQAMAAFRHRFMARRMAVHDDDAAHAAEIAGAHTGRCEAWQYGKLHGGPFYEHDFSCAYARIAAELPVPTRYVGKLRKAAYSKILDPVRTHATLAEVTVSTDVPTVPCRYDGRIVWPIGTFRTTLWENELRLAVEHGATIEVHDAYMYRKGTELRPFCEWALDIVDERTTEHTPLQRAIVKHWTRALIGRFAMQSSSWEQVGECPWSDVALTRFRDSASDVRSEYMHLGTQMLMRTDTQLGPQAIPSIMSWIMAECRLRLWRTVQVAGVEHVAYMDTDSIIVDRAGHERLEAANVPHLRVKSRADVLEVIGPRRYIMHGRLRAAGVPMDAVRVGWRTWEADVWAGLATSLRSGRSGEIVVTPRTIKLADRDERRQRRAAGGSSPRHVRIA